MSTADEIRIMTHVYGRRPPVGTLEAEEQGATLGARERKRTQPEMSRATNFEKKASEMLYAEDRLNLRCDGECFVYLRMMGILCFQFRNLKELSLIYY